MATRQQEGTGNRERGDACAVVVFYEDLAARDTALRLRDRLMLRFRGDLEFGFNWWRIEYLADPDIAQEAAGIANAADLILVSLNRSEEVRLTVETWLGTCLSNRSLADGALVIIRSSPLEEERNTQADTGFRAMASRTNLDYLPLSVRPFPPLSLDRLREDATHPAAEGWKDIPGHRYHSSGWGLNE